MVKPPLCDAVPFSAAFMPMPAWFGADPVFADLERISAAVDHQAAQMLRSAASPHALTSTEIASLPAGGQEYTFVSTMTGNGVCSESVEITSRGNGAPPQVVRHSSGNCGAGAALQTAPTVHSAPADGARPIMTRASEAHPYSGLIREAALR